MPRLLGSLTKLKGKSLDELRVRCRQAARAHLERVGLSGDAAEPSDRAFARVFDFRGVSRLGDPGDELLRQFRRDDLELGRYLPGLDDLTHTAAEFRARCPRSAAVILAAAERILAGIVKVGDRDVSIGTHPDWTLEYVHGKRAPAIHWSRIAFLDPEVAGDCKFTWDLNRHQYFVTLGQAYLLTGDDRYASCVATHLSSWIDANPPKIGINWTSSLELALRSISWIWSLSLVRHSPSLAGGLYLRALKSLYLHARHIERNLSTYFSPNTHLTGEALGLLYISAAFPAFKRARYWRALALGILTEQLERQVLQDGVYFEQSTYYHRYTADFYLHAALLTSEASEPPNGDMRAVLGALLDYLLHITRPNGSSPLIGDDDGGRLVTLAERPANDFRDTLAIGAALLQRGDCAYVAGTGIEELLWLLGPRGIAAYDDLTPVPPAPTSCAFRDSGYFVMRQSWDRDADWAIVRCGRHAAQNGAHAHADALSIEMSIGGAPMLVDPGTYVYTASRAERDYFRGSAAHNTLTVDGRSSAEPALSAFKWSSVPFSRATAWITHERFDFFAGEHDGYRRLESPALHSRAIFYQKGEYWVVCDRVRCDAPHHLALYWHWAPSVIVCDHAPDTVTARTANANDRQVSARFFSRGGRVSCEQGWTSTTYGVRARSAVSVLRLDSDHDEEFVSVIADSGAVRSEDCSWQALSDDAGVLTVVTVSTIDTILTGPTIALEHASHGVISDAAWTWVRRSPAGEPLAFAIINGRQLRIDGQPVFGTGSVADCASGHHRSDGWHIAVDRRGLRSATWSLSGRKNEASCAASAE